MRLLSKFERVHFESKQNLWMRYFTVFCRVALAAGFIPSGFVKIMGERFTALPGNHPLGHYLDALHTTGYYYTFIGIAQMTAAFLLLIPRTATLGALLYFPIIVNICVLSLAVGFDGSLLSSPMMVLANLYLLCWDYDKLKFIVAPQRLTNIANHNTAKPNKRFPFRFFTGVFLTVVATGFVVTNAYTIRTRNTLRECQTQCNESENPQACEDFCNCIHTQGKSYDQCVADYKNAINRKKQQND
jgi:uncharacterized membrane protein YphA (DoxX/SURF4 family)